MSKSLSDRLDALEAEARHLRQECDLLRQALDKMTRALDAALGDQDVRRTILSS